MPAQSRPVEVGAIRGVFQMRKLLLAVVVMALVAAACASSTVGTGGSPTTSTTSCDKASLHLLNAGQLTIATDSPVYSPWFKKNTPSNGLGYESALAYAVASQLGFSRSEVTWVVEPFNKSYAPGPKDFDFDINEISITPERSQVVSFSTGYYDDAQALVAVKGTPIANATTIAALKPYKLGDQIGSTSLQFIATMINPTQQPAVFDTLNEAKSSLNAGQIDGVVTDLPTADYFQYQVKNGTVVGRFAPAGEQFGLLFQKGNPLVTCVDQALATLATNGTIQQLQDTWLQSYAAYPVIK